MWVFRRPAVYSTDIEETMMMRTLQTLKEACSVIGEYRESVHRSVMARVLTGVLVLGLGVSWVPSVLGADPITVLVDQDAWLKEAAPGDNFGDEKELPIKNKATDNERAVFRFDLSPVPLNAEISQATASFRVTTADSSPVNIYRITSDWTEHSVTWGTTGTAFDPSIRGTFTPSQDDGFVAVDLTNLVQDWFCGTPNQGIIFIPTSNDEQSKYHSKEEDITSFRPSMDITVGPGPGPCSPNQAPVADAGLDQPVQVSDTVQLDGSSSTDADGDTLSFLWTLENLPTGSTATLIDANSVLPTLIIDEPGDYVIQLIVNDGIVDSDPDTVTLSTGNVAPVAHAGPDQTIAVTQPAFLDGMQSSDANGDALTYQWTITSQPANSSTTLDDPTSAMPSFTVDQVGTYTVTLLVSDGLLTSEADLVIIATDNSAPVAHAGPDHDVRPGTTVTLDGSSSSDVDGNPLTYQWSQTVVPPGNTATISDPTAAAPTLTPDAEGDYVAQLLVNDGTATSEPDTALIRVGNTTPIADAGPDQLVSANTTVQLDGGNSSDPQDDPLTYQWTLVSPAGSSSTLSDATIADPTFVTDVEGTYTATLIVNDGDLDSDSDTVEIIVTSTVQPPTITGFTPTTGPMGTVITITGEHFDPVLANNQVQLNGNALILSGGSATSLTATVPSSATTGLLTVTTPEGTATSATPFTLISRTDFTLQAVPPVATAVQGGAASYAITLTTQGEFTNLVSLSLSNVPPTVSATLSSPAISANQTVFLTLSPTAATPAGVIPVTLVGTTTLDTGLKTETLPLNLHVLAAGGQTSVSGQFLTADTETPIPGVIVNIGANQVTTDAAGRFLLQNVPAGLQKLIISGDMPEGAFSYSIDYTFVAGQAHVLPPLYQTPAPPLDDFMAFNNGTQDQVFTDARFPGLSYTLPAGVTIIGWDNQPKTGLAFEQVPLDRLGIPMPPVEVKSAYKPVFRTATGVSAMGGFLDPPGSLMPFSLPNDLGLHPGDQAEMWVYDASPVDFSVPSGWKLAGLGTVSADGTQIDSNPGVGISRFCQKCGTASCSCAGNSKCNDPNKNQEGDEDGDPVDLGTGTFTADQMDLTLPGLVPINFGRTFNATDAFRLGAGPFRPGQELKLSFGRGWVSSYDIALVPRGDVQVLVLPGNSRVDLALQPDGTWTTQTHSFLLGAVLREIAPDERELRFKDGRLWRFRLAHTYGDGSTLDFLSHQQDRNGNTVTIERNGVMITRIIDASGRVLDVTTTSNGISEVRDPIGRTVTYEYDNNRRLTAVTDPEGGLTEYTYDAKGNLLTITDARGIAFITNHYGVSNRVLRQVMADGGEWRYRYHLQGATVTGPDCPGLLCPMEESWETVQAGYSFLGGTICATTVIDPVGMTRTTRFNNRGYTIDRTDGLGQKTLITRGSGNVVTKRVNSLGHAVNFGYDERGNVTRIVDPKIQETRLEYEPNFSGVSRITNALNKDTTFDYDTRGNVTQVTNPVQATSFVTTSVHGQILHIQLPDLMEPPTSFAYDPVGNLTTITNPLGQAVQRTFDEVSRVTAFSEPRGFTTRLDYDGLNQVTRITNPVGGISTFGYDGNGNLVNRTNANINQVFTHTYDPMDRLTSTGDPLNRQFSFQYDQIGNVKVLTDRKNQPTTYDYDTLNRPTSIIYGDGSTLTYEYDTAGRLHRIVDSQSGTIEWIYDELDRVIQEITPQGSVSYQYDAIGRRTQMVVNGQTPVTYTYDDADRLTRVEQGSVFAAMTYDVNDRRTSLTYSNGTTTTYTYDDASQVTGITHTGPGGLIEQVSYTYDEAGNQSSVIRTNGAGTILPAAVASAIYDAANEQTSFDGTALTYDAKGALTSDGTNTYIWDARDRLIAINGPTLTASFTYDALGRRISKTINGQTTTFVYDGDDIVAEVDSQAGVVTYLRGLSIDEPFVRQTATGNEYYHVDVLGSTVVLSDDAGTTNTTYTYDPFGKTTVSGLSTNAFQYTSRENDGTGLYYYRARYYSPTFHRFISEDPIGVEGGDENFYAYTFNSPLNFTDPSGELAFAPFIPPVVTCLRGAGQSIFLDVLSGRKPSLSEAALGCATGGANKVISATKTLGVAGKAGKFGKPPLKRIHSDKTLNTGSNKRNLESQRTRSTRDIIDSLKPGAKEPLTVKPDGRIVDGNTRIKVLEERGVDINNLPRTILD